MDFWHYQPWWLQPYTIIGSGVAFFVLAVVFDNEPFWKAATMAAATVALYWGILLFLVPRQFKSFAVDYLETHPQETSKSKQKK